MSQGSSLVEYETAKKEINFPSNMSFANFGRTDTFLDHMQLDLGRYLLPFGRARLIISPKKCK